MTHSPQNCLFPWRDLDPNQYMITCAPARVLNPNGIMNSSPTCTAHDRASSCFRMGRFLPSKLPFPTGVSGPHLIHDSLAHPGPQPKQHFSGFSHFCTDDRRVFLCFTMGSAFPLKVAPSHGRCGPHLIRGSLSPPKSSARTASRSVQPFLSGSLV